MVYSKTITLDVERSASTFIMYYYIDQFRRAGHSRVAFLAAMPQFTFCPHPAVYKFICNILPVGAVIGRPRYCEMGA